MKTSTSPCRFLAGQLFLLLAAAPVLLAADAGSITIDHPGAKCVVADRYPRIGARVSPAESAARVRAYFKAAETPSWYFVELSPEGDAFAGTLPKPKKAAHQINYYIEAIGTSLAVTRTSEFSPMVVGAGECGKGEVALESEPANKNSRVAVGSVSTNVPVIPTGFSEAGVVRFTAQSEGSAKAKDAHKEEKKEKSEKKGEPKKKG
jgi:hypothetical protein